MHKISPDLQDFFEISPDVHRDGMSSSGLKKDAKK